MLNQKGYAAYCLSAIHDALKQERRRLSIVLSDKAAVGCDRRELICKDTLVERDQVAVLCCLLEAGEF